MADDDTTRRHPEVFGARNLVADLDLDAKFLAHLPAQGFLGVLSGFNLAAGKLPQPRKRGWARPTSREERAWRVKIVDDRRTDNQSTKCRPTVDPLVYPSHGSPISRR